MGEREFPTRISSLRKMADILLSVRTASSVNASPIVGKKLGPQIY